MLIKNQIVVEDFDYFNIFFQLIFDYNYIPNYGFTWVDFEFNGEATNCGH